jgi:hypothetical protein
LSILHGYDNALIGRERMLMLQDESKPGQDSNMPRIDGLWMRKKATGVGRCLMLMVAVSNDHSLSLIMTVNESL